MTKENRDSDIFAEELFDTDNFENVRLGKDEPEEKTEEYQDILDGFAAEADEDEDWLLQSNSSPADVLEFGDTGKEEEFVGQSADQVAPSEGFFPDDRELPKNEAVYDFADDNDRLTAPLDQEGDETAFLGSPVIPQEDETALFDSSSLPDEDETMVLGSVDIPDEDETMVVTMPLDATDETVAFNPYDVRNKVEEGPADDEFEFETAPIDTEAINEKQAPDTAFETAPIDSHSVNRKASDPNDVYIDEGVGARKDNHKKFKIFLGILVALCAIVISVLGVNAYNARKQEEKAKQEVQVQQNQNKNTKPTVKATDRDNTGSSSSSSNSSYSEDTNSNNTNYDYDSDDDTSYSQDEDYTHSSDQDDQSTSQNGTTDQSTSDSSSNQGQNGGSSSSDTSTNQGGSTQTPNSGSEDSDQTDSDSGQTAQTANSAQAAKNPQATQAAAKAK